MNYITREGMQRLMEQMNTLTKERVVVIKQVVEAREMGDLSENAEYHAARERQRHIDNEMNRLRARIGVLKVIDPSQLPKDAIRFGAVVNVKEESTGLESKHQLVGIDEVYDREDEITLTSIASPLGKAMIGKKVGENFVVKAPIGDRVFKVLDIK